MRLLPNPSLGSQRILDLVDADAGVERFQRVTQGIDVFYSRRLGVQTALRAALLDAWGGKACDSIARAVRDRRWGAIRLFNPASASTEVNLGRLACALACLCGSPYAPLNQGNCVRSNLLQHIDPGARFPGQRSPYLPDPLHTEVHDCRGLGEDFLVLSCVAREHCVGGRTLLLHLDDWDERERFLACRHAFQPFPWVFPRTGLLSHDNSNRCDRSLFWRAEGWLCIRLSPGNMQPPQGPHDSHAAYVNDLQASLARSPSLHRFVLEPGELMVLNNRVWVHGREPLHLDPLLRRHLLSVHAHFADSRHGDIAKSPSPEST